MSDSLSSCISLMRRFPPKEVEKSLAGLGKLVEDDEMLDQLHQRVDKPLELGKCEATGSDFILCEYNKDADSYRSPWSNQYQPPFPEAIMLPEPLRNLELKANEAFQEYVRLYYEYAISSVYCWETEPNEFACVFAVKKMCDPVEEYKVQIWESSNVIKVKWDPATKKASYVATSSVNLELVISHIDAGDIELSGSAGRYMQYMKNPVLELYDEGHIYHLISFVEQVETELRNSLDLIYIGKTQQILDNTRRIEPVQQRGQPLPGLV